MSTNPTGRAQTVGNKANTWGARNPYEIKPGLNDWGKALNENMGTVDARLTALEKKPEPNTATGIIAGAATAAAIGMSSAKPVSRRGLFDAFRKR